MRICRKAHLQNSALLESRAVWRKFFDALALDPDPKFLSERPGGLIHAYLEAQLSLGQMPAYVDLVREHQMDVIDHHMQLLEHASSDETSSSVGSSVKMDGSKLCQFGY
jgi:hypothetical protein